MFRRQTTSRLVYSTMTMLAVMIKRTTTMNTTTRTLEVKSVTCGWTKADWWYCPTADDWILFWFTFLSTILPQSAPTLSTLFYNWRLLQHWCFLLSFSTTVSLLSCLILFVDHHLHTLCVIFSLLCVVHISIFSLISLFANCPTSFSPFLVRRALLFVRRWYKMCYIREATEIRDDPMIRDWIESTKLSKQ